MDFLKPHSVVEYNRNVGVVETGDSILHDYPTLRKTVNWYKKLFWGLLDISH